MYFQVAKDELEKQQRELHEMMQRLEESKNLEAEERARLEEEILQKKNEVINDVCQICFVEFFNYNFIGYMNILSILANEG